MKNAFETNWRSITSSIFCRRQSEPIPIILSFVGAAGRPEPIPDQEIDSLRTLLRNSSQFVCYPYLKQGMLVEVISGPLQGIKGRLVREARGARLVLSITLIQRAVAIEIDAANVAPAQSALIT